MTEQECNIAYREWIARAHEVAAMFVRCDLEMPHTLKMVLGFAEASRPPNP